MVQKRKMDLTKYREALLAERESLTNQIRRIDDRTSGRDRLDSQVSAEDFDEPGGDAASDTLERSKSIAIGESLRETLAQVEHAMLKLEKGTYGICDSCEKAIAKGRLDFLPYASMCAECRKRLSM